MKTSELTGAALDWAVAKCENLPLKLDPMGFRKDAPTSIQAGWWVWDGEAQNQVIGHRKTRRNEEAGYSPSTDWAQGGSIIERQKLCLGIGHAGVWLAFSMQNYEDEKNFMNSGPTPLIAAMRCYVASKLGDTVNIPAELTI